MGATFDRIYEAFDEHDRRLAVFDRGVRERQGLWTLAEPVPIEPILDHVTSIVDTDGDGVPVPLHEPDSATLTGRYVRYRPDDVAPCVVYYDAREGTSRIPLDELATAYPAWQLRFWHPEISDPGGRSPSGTVTEHVPSSTSASAASQDLLEAAREFVERERAAERAETRSAFESMTQSAFFDRYGGIPQCRPAGRWHDEELGQVCGLTVVDEEDVPQSAVDLPETYGIHPGNEVIIDSDRAGDGLPVEAELLRVEGAVLHLGVYWDTAQDKNAAERAFDRGGEADFAVGRLVNPTPYDRRLDGIRDCAEDPRKSALLTGDRTPGTECDVGLGGIGTGLNEYQRRAAEASLRADDVHVIHGPPGTGKTRTIVAAVRAAVDRGERILVVAHSNQAVDNVLVGGSTADWTDPRSLHAGVESGEITAARAGENTNNGLVEERYADNSIWQADVVAATTSASHRFVPDAFDRVYVDEAGQASVPATVLAFSRAKRLILVGDHRQLPPYRSDEADHEESMGPSLLESMIDVYGEEIVSFLGRQYRMHREIAAFPNDTFYDGALEHGERNRTWALGNLAPLVARQVDGTEEAAPGGSWYNEAEARATARAVGRLLRNGVPPKDIGVITPYSGQVSKIAAALRDLDHEAILDRIDVDTVDAFQGGERDAIVISFVRSNQQGTTGFLTFPEEGPRRLNVALTRARKRLELIGDWETLTAENGEGGSSDGVWAYRALHQHLRDRECFAGTES